MHGVPSAVALLLPLSTMNLAAAASRTLLLFRDTNVGQMTIATHLPAACQRALSTKAALRPCAAALFRSSPSEHSTATAQVHRQCRRGGASLSSPAPSFLLRSNSTFTNALSSRRSNTSLARSMSTVSKEASDEGAPLARAVVHPTVESIRAVRKSLDPSVSVGFVPTMGALHEGHLSLARAARAENDVVIASIFVNPTQFGKGEDLDKYPRQLEKDVDMLTEIGVDHVFAPSSDIMYGKNHVTYVEPTGFDNTREGISRPGHFRGVATVVTKLFNIVQPTNAYFGQKDAVQCVLIRRIADDLDMDTNVQIMDTVREHDGLAMSSRNAYLTAEERSVAPIVYKALCAGREMFDSRLARGMEEVDATDLQEVVESVLKSEPMITEVQYVAVDDLDNMQQLDKVGNDGCIISLACKLGSVRLIDNIVLK